MRSAWRRRTSTCTSIPNLGCRCTTSTATAPASAIRPGCGRSSTCGRSTRTWINAGPRHFAADLHLIEWLETKRFRYDVITDEDLHRDGEALLSPYKVVLTGSHPEYWTTPMMDALEAYLTSGGRLMYLGGNGFYWVTDRLGRPH